MNTTQQSHIGPPQTCNLFGPDDTWKCNTIIGVRRASASLSLIGCTLIVIAIWLFRKHQFIGQRLVLNLSVSGFMASIGYLMGGTYIDGPVCDFEGFWITLFEWSILLCVCCFTFNIFSNAILMKTTDHYIWGYYFVIWVLPLVIACLPLIGNHYGPSGAWCWIPPEYPDWRFGIWYAPLFTIIGLLILTYVAITVLIRQRLKRWEGIYSPELERARQILKEDVKPLLGYPFVYFLTSTMALANRINNFANPDQPVFALYILHSLFAPLSGALNALVFSMDRDMWSRLTWVQIKAFFLSHLRPRPIIKEVDICTDPFENMAAADTVNLSTDNVVLSFNDGEQCHLTNM